MNGGEVDRLVPLALARRAVAEGGEDRAPALAAQAQCVGGADGMGELGGDDRGEARDAELPARIMVRELPPRRLVGGAGEEREQHVVGAEPDAEREAEVAIVGEEEVVPAGEGHRGPRLHAFVPLACRGEGNLALPVELEAAMFEHALQKHRAQHRHELLVGEPGALEGRRGLVCGSHGETYSPGSLPKSCGS